MRTNITKTKTLKPWSCSRTPQKLSTSDRFKMTCTILHRLVESVKEKDTYSICQRREHNDIIYNVSQPSIYHCQDRSGKPQKKDTRARLNHVDLSNFTRLFLYFFLRLTKICPKTLLRSMVESCNNRTYIRCFFLLMASPYQQF